MKKDKLFSIWQMKWIFLVGMIIIIGAVMAFGLLGALFLHFERDQALSMIWMIPIMLVVYYGAVKIMLDNMQGKMGRLADGIHEVAGGNLDVEIPLEEAEEYTRLYEEFNQMVRELKQTREQMEAFTGEFAHEFKTPITSISGFSEYLCETAGPDEQAGFSGETEERLKYLKVIRDQSRRLADLSQSTLLLSKLNAMEVAPPPEKLNAGEQIRQTIILMEKQLDEKQIDLDIPVVLVNSEPSVEGILCYVGQNTVQSGSVAARMLSLFMNGSSRIGIISCHNMITHEQREQSFISNVNDFFPGFSIRDIRYILETPENAREQTLEMLRSHPEIDSVFITCGCVPEICAALREYREETGSEIRPVVICYEKYEEIRALLKTGDISCTLSGGLFMQGRLSMRILFEYLVYEKVPEHKAYYLNNKIMIRENS